VRKPIAIGVVGDYDKSVPAHQAIPLVLQRTAEVLHVPVIHEWIPTEEIVAASRIATFSGLWCVPASPYRSMEGALLAIRHARESGAPFLGTCGGFQHAVIEYARNVLGWADAEHAGTAPDAARAVISLLGCPLVEASGDVRAVELDGHPFFVATLFQPERAALAGKTVPLAVAFVSACAA
jgi:CTP synthase (UTP-ammonia lyase)